ncbi:MAG: sulfotransferase [Colwellia sp.]|nr:sulfotransferase [Colwellia sp.]
MSKYSKPLLFKNLNMGQRLQLIKEIYPDAKIIFIRRDPRFVVRSILVAREKLGLDPDEWWSVRPPNHERFIGLPEIEMCAAQVFYIEDQIKKDLEILDSNNVFTIQFNQLSEEKIDEIASALGLTKKQGTLMPIFQKDEVSSLSSPEFASIGSAIQKFEFEKELFV